MLEVFQDSPYIEIYRNKLANVSISQVETSQIFLQQLPCAFNEDYVQRNMKMISYELLKQKCKDIDYSTLFLLGGLKNNISDLMIKMGFIDIIEREETREILFFYDLRKKEIYGALIEKAELQELVQQDNNSYVLLTSYKNYDYENNCIPNYSIVKETVYIYCDRTYSNAISYIKRWDNRVVFYRYMIYESMVVLLVKINQTALFMLPMTPMVASEAEKDIRNKHKNMQPVNVQGNEEYDPYIIKDEKIRNDIDTIINCLFFINLSVSDEE